MWPFNELPAEPMTIESFDPDYVVLNNRLRHSDVLDAQAIEFACFGAASDPETYRYWEEDEMVRCGTAHYGKRLIGFYHTQIVMGQRDEDGEVVPDYFRLINLAVHPDFQRLGVGTRLIRFLQFGSNLREIYRIVEVCHEHNDAAISFFRKCGFKGIAIDRNAFFNTEDGTFSDGVVMQLIWQGDLTWCES